MSDSKILFIEIWKISKSICVDSVSLMPKLIIVEFATTIEWNGMIMIGIFFNLFSIEDQIVSWKRFFIYSHRRYCNFLGKSKGNDKKSCRPRLWRNSEYEILILCVESLALKDMIFWIPSKLESKAFFGIDFPRNLKNCNIIDGCRWKIYFLIIYITEVHRISNLSPFNFVRVR